MLGKARLKAEQAAEAARSKAVELEERHDLKQRATQASQRISASVEAAGDAAAAAVRDSQLLDSLVSDDRPGTDSATERNSPALNVRPDEDGEVRPCVASARCDRHCQSVAEHMAGGPAATSPSQVPATEIVSTSSGGGGRAKLPPPLPRPGSAELPAWTDGQVETNTSTANVLALPSVPTGLPSAAVADPPPAASAKLDGGSAELLSAVRAKASVTAVLLGQRASQLDEKYSLSEKAKEAAEKTRAAAEDVRKSAAAAAEDAKAYYEREREKPPESEAARLLREHALSKLYVGHVLLGGAPIRFRPAVFGPTRCDIVEATPVWGRPVFGCDSERLLDNAAEVAGKVVVFRRDGGVDYLKKAVAAERAGAVAVIVINSVDRLTTPSLPSKPSVAERDETEQASPGVEGVALSGSVDNTVAEQSLTQEPEPEPELRPEPEAETPAGQPINEFVSVDLQEELDDAVHPSQAKVSVVAAGASGAVAAASASIDMHGIAAGEESRNAGANAHSSPAVDGLEPQDATGSMPDPSAEEGIPLLGDQHERAGNSTSGSPGGTTFCTCGCGMEQPSPPNETQLANRRELTALLLIEDNPEMEEVATKVAKGTGAVVGGAAASEFAVVSAGFVGGRTASAWLAAVGGPLGVAAAVTITAVTAVQGYKMLSSDGQLDQLTALAKKSGLRCQRIDELVTASALDGVHISSSSQVNELKIQLRERLGIDQLKQNVSDANGASFDVSVEPGAPEGERIPVVLVPLGRFHPGQSTDSTSEVLQTDSHAGDGAGDGDSNGDSGSRLPESVSIYYERGVDPQSIKGQKLLIKLAGREVSMATKEGLRGAAEGTKVLAATGKEAVEELRKEETQKKLRLAAAKQREAIEASAVQLATQSIKVAEKSAAFVELSAAKASEAANWAATETGMRGTNSAEAEADASAVEQPADVQKRMAIVHDSFDPADPSDMAPFASTMPTQVAGARRIGPVAVDAGCVVKILDDVCGDESHGEWWHVEVPSTGAVGLIPASVAISTASGGSDGAWSTI